MHPLYFLNSVGTGGASERRLSDCPGVSTQIRMKASISVVSTLQEPEDDVNDDDDSNDDDDGFEY
jgi:hypothetical protein